MVRFKHGHNAYVYRLEFDLEADPGIHLEFRVDFVILWCVVVKCLIFFCVACVFGDGNKSVCTGRTF